MENEKKVSVVLKGKSITWMNWYCEEVDMTPAQVLRSAFAEKISTFLQGHSGVHGRTPEFSDEKTKVSAGGQSPRARTRETKNLSLDKSNSTNVECRNFFKAFLGKLEKGNVKFPERISKEMRNQWEAIVESKLTAEELADSYNQYVKDSKRKDDKFCHPNSWINGHGWKNEVKEASDEPEGDFDF